MIAITITVKGDIENFVALQKLYDIIKRESFRAVEGTKISARVDEEEPTKEVEE